MSGDTVAGAVVQAGSIRELHVHAAAPPTGSTPGSVAMDAWERRAGDSCVWQHVPAGRDTGHHRRHVTALAARLARMRDELEGALEQDPWCDARIATAFLDHVEWLLGEPAQDGAAGLDLYPAEASLLVLLPFLHRVHYLRRAVRLAEVRPWSLRPESNAGPDREAFEIFAEESEALVQRALRDPEAEPLVGWWLCHRRLTQHEEFSEADSVPGLLEELGESAAELGAALTADRVTVLLHGLRRGPDICHPEFLGLLPADERVRCGPGHQQIRYQRVGLLAALAHGMSVEMTTLPDIVAEHLAIPYPVDVPLLRHTLTQAHWGGSRDLPVLRAECRHEAVVEGLREYTARADTVLHAIRRTVRERVNQPMPDLPTRLSADGVVPSRGTFDGYARFRSDGRRVLDLAMGIELYKDRDLAVRELYQNALDACRYRRARQECLDRTTEPFGAPYTGRISFVQDTDEDGRAYLDCQDDGIGMGEAELRGVFSHAGARFAEQLEFKLERARWESLDPPVTLYPNSRFGIGVLSYFMLAEEIRVTTCRMDADGVPGPVYEVSICGPGHLFRIVQKAARGREPGTRVRLYLRADVAPENWSVIDVLERVLAIAEFPTSARKGGLSSAWEPGRLKERQRPDRSDTGLNAYGAQLDWDDGPQDAQVVWCEHGGALLVDGVVVEPTVRKGVFPATGPGLTGAVVNLRGPSAPARLSVDRRHVLDDVTAVVRELLEKASGVLAEGEEDDLPGVQWLNRVADDSAALADIVDSALFSRGREPALRGVKFGGPRAGYFAGDLTLVPGEPRDANRYGGGAWGHVEGHAPDHVYLWRLLARRGALGKLAEVCPEIDDPRPVLRPVPSDQWLLMHDRQSGHSRRWRRGPFDLSDIARAADALQRPSREVAARLAALGFPEADPRHWSPGAELTTADSATFTSQYGEVLTRHEPLTSADLMGRAARANDSVAATAERLRGFGFQLSDTTVTLCQAAEKDELLWLNREKPEDGCLDPGAEVPPGHIAQASLRLGLSVQDVCRRLAAHGLRADPAGLPDRPTLQTVLLLSSNVDGEPPWLDRARTPPPGHALHAAEELGLAPAEVLARLCALGFARPDPFPADASTDDLWALDDELYGDFLVPPGPIPYGNVFSSVQDLDGLRLKIRRMRSYGFDIALEVPRRPTSLDRELLCESGPFNWWFTRTDEAVPFAQILMASRELGAQPATIAKRLRACNIATSHDGLPRGLSFSEARRLIRADELDEGEVPAVEDFPLQYLHRTALRKRTGLRQIVSLLNDLGIPVPDPAETIRAALARVPRADP
ncbi:MULTISPECIES: ATP-binding protein [Streptomyces]|uniref:wHTH domain-containing protein n=1 Tax=Streptomyces TaxID=1883 RepID=UPI001E629FCF|nr:ATP-binding protein [Streptomyces chartreusis]